MYDAAERAKHGFLTQALGARGAGAYQRHIDFMRPRASAAVDAAAWYLSIIGVTSSAQGRGIGRLDRAQHRRALGTRRFQQLCREVDGVTQKMLTRTLRGLERDALVSRGIYPAVPPRIEYSLAPLGQTFTKPLWGLKKWAETHVEEIEASSAAWGARMSSAGD